MLCQICRTEAVISSNNIEVEGDNSTETPTKVYRRLEVKCRNEKCINFGQTVGEKRNLIYEKTSKEV